MVIHKQLSADTHYLGDLDRSVVVLHCNAMVPWLILIPSTEQTEFLELEPSLRATLLEQASLLGRFVQEHFCSEKINFAAIGNIVPQLHLHVVGRDRDDCCWPNPIWGHLKDSRAYSPDQVESIRQVLVDKYGLDVPTNGK